MLLLLSISQLMILIGGPDLLHWHISVHLCLGNVLAISCFFIFWSIFFFCWFHLCSFVHNRHNFVLPHAEKLQIWTIVEKLLIDGQVEVSFLPCTHELQYVILYGRSKLMHVFISCDKLLNSFSNLMCFITDLFLVFYALRCSNKGWLVCFSTFY